MYFFDQKLLGPDGTYIYIFLDFLEGLLCCRKHLQHFRRSFSSSKHAISSFFLFRGEKLDFILPDLTPHLIGYLSNE
jgi:hypothetical protein